LVFLTQFVGPELFVYATTLF